MPDETTYIMVLNDGETFTDLAGCKIVRVPDEMETEEIEENLKADKLDVIRLFDLVPREADWS